MNGGQSGLTHESGDWPEWDVGRMCWRSCTRSRAQPQRANYPAVGRWQAATLHCRASREPDSSVVQSQEIAALAPPNTSGLLWIRPAVAPGRILFHKGLMPTLTEVHSMAMKLPKTSRLRLASELNESSGETDTSWSPADILAEAARRDEEVESGRVKAIALEDFMSKTNDRRSKLADG